MDQAQKRSLTAMRNIPLFQKTMEKLTTNIQLDEDEKNYILACAIILLKNYDENKTLISYADFAYYIIIKYSTQYNDYAPLYDFCANFGFYPVAKSILDRGLINGESINDCLLDIQLEGFKANSYIETYHQYKGRNGLLGDNSNELGYIAPTSFGKSSIIVDMIRKHLFADVKIGIIVPTKSLLMQTYRMIRDADLKTRILIHDEMYQEENSFIAIFTQERALRLMSKHNVFFDILFIDEAHNIFKDDSRSVLLSRLIAKNRMLNQQHKVIYLSPLVEDVKSLTLTKDQKVSEHKIPFNIKEPEIHEYKLDGSVHMYNRFLGEFYSIDTSPSIFTYIESTSRAKNFLYNYRPVKIELLAKELSYSISQRNITPAIKELVKILKQEVHENFYAVDYVEYGVIYLHGKLPDLIKEYLESKFRDLPEIKYIIANSVILEGMNLPIDNLYILNTLSLYGKELTNLIGRVNRLNTIFNGEGNNLDKLLPKVHFVNSEYNRVNSNMSTKIELLRSRTFKDEIDNPTLDNYDLEAAKLSEDNLKKVKAIQENEKFLVSPALNELDELKKYLLESGINEFYEDLNTLATVLQEKIKKISSREDWENLNMMEKINDLFIQGFSKIKDLEFSRLSYPEARSYYEFHITVSLKKSLKENVNHMFDYFKKRRTEGDRLQYFGKTYGELEKSVTPDTYSPRVYIDLSTKTDTELINLAIVKLKMEDDFISFKLNKFIVMLHDYELISDDDYNKYIYGTTDQKKIGLTKIGLSVNLISRLEKDDQLKYLRFDPANNLIASKEFNEYKANANDFYRFEIERFIN